MEEEEAPVIGDTKAWDTGYQDPIRFNRGEKPSRNMRRRTGSYAHCVLCRMAMAIDVMMSTDTFLQVCFNAASLTWRETKEL